MKTDRKKKKNQKRRESKIILHSFSLTVVTLLTNLPHHKKCPKTEMKDQNREQS